MHFLTTRIKSLKIYFFTSGKVKNVFLCICAYFKTTRIKSLKNYILTSGVVKNVFWCISRTPESSEWWKTCFDAFTDHQNQVLNKLFFNVWSSSKRVFCICAYLQTTRIKSLKNNFFYLWSGEKRVLMHFLITRI